MYSRSFISFIRSLLGVQANYTYLSVLMTLIDFQGQGEHIANPSSECLKIFKNGDLWPYIICIIYIMALAEFEFLKVHVIPF